MPAGQVEDVVGSFTSKFSIFLMNFIFLKICGCVSPLREQGGNIPRFAALLAGFPGTFSTKATLFYYEILTPF